MPIVNVNNWSQGINREVPPDHLAEGQAEYLFNLTPEESVLRVNNGRVRHGTAVAGSVIALSEHHQQATSITAEANRIVGVVRTTDSLGSGYSVLASSDDGDGDLGDPYELLVVTTSPTARPRLTTAGRHVWLTDGVRPITKILGLPLYPMASSSPRDMAGWGTSGFGAQGPGGIALDDETSPNYWVCDPSAKAIQRFSNTGQRLTAISTSTGSWEPLGVCYGGTHKMFVVAAEEGTTGKHVYVYSSSAPIAKTTDFLVHGSGATEASAPTDIVATGGYVYILDPGTSKMLKFNAGTYAHVADYAFPVTVTLTHICVDANTGILYCLDSDGISVYSFDPSSPTFVLSAVAPSAAGSGIGYDDFRDKFLIPTGPGLVEAIDVTGVLIEKWSVPYADDPTTGESNAFGTYGRILKARANSVNTLLMVANMTFGRLEFLDVADDVSGFDDFSHTLLPIPVPTQRPLIATTVGNTGQLAQAGTYEVCFTYRLFDRDGWVETQPGPIGTFEYLGVALKTLTITALPTTVEGWGVARGLTMLRVWLRDPTTAGEFFLLQERLVRDTGAMQATYEDFGFVRDGATVLIEEDASRPPDGCVLCGQVGDRLIFAKGDTLFVSAQEWRFEKHGFERIPGVKSFDEALEGLGGYIRVGNDGAPITGIGTLGKEAVIAKGRSLWRIACESSLPNYGLYLIDMGSGCVAHETMISAAGALFWLDRNTAWSWDGNRLEDIGKPLGLGRVTITNHEARFALAFATYSPEEDAVEFVYPATGSQDLADDTCAGTGFRFNLKRRIWSDLLYQPAACAVYFRLLDTSGVYAGDYGTVSDDGWLYRLYTGSYAPDSPGMDETCPQSWNLRTPSISVAPGKNMDFRRVVLSLRAREASATVYFGLRINEGVAITSQSITTSNLTMEAGFAEWSPPLLSGVRSAQIDLSAYVDATTDDPVDTVDAVLMDFKVRGGFGFRA